MAVEKAIPSAPFGRGWMFDRDNEVFYGLISDVLVKDAIGSVKIPHSLDPGMIDLQTSREFTIQATLVDITPAGWAALLGGTHTAAGSKHYKTEVLALSGSPKTATLSKGAGTGESVDVVMKVIGDTTGYDYTEEVATAAGEAFTRSGVTLTFHASETETSITVYYVYVSGASSTPAGEKIAINPGDMPTTFSMILAEQVLRTDTGAERTNNLVEFNTVRRSGDLNVIDWAAQATKGKQVQFMAFNNNAGDVVFHMGAHKISS